ncbi:MAG: Holliday junction branch migration protein RuvA [Chloroflexi bacterium]|nr:Holliday junction branch migration protein RuvA [Chloroflexota bacterium]
MIAGLTGIIEIHGPDSVVINVNGISFRVYTPNPSSLGSSGDKIHLYTNMQVKENYIAVFGFYTPEELWLFELLISVNGIGPKTALVMLSTININQIATAIAMGDLKVLTKIPGIGPKIAGRLVLELKGKLDNWKTSSAQIGFEGDTEVLAALRSLGYTTAEANAAISSISGKDLSLEEKIMLCLQYLGKR